jgi:hypothetical protein
MLRGNRLQIKMYNFFSEFEEKSRGCVKYSVLMVIHNEILNAGMQTFVFICNKNLQVV